jgi:hypothetical protein
MHDESTESGQIQYAKTGTQLPEAGAGQGFQQGMARPYSSSA